MFGYLPKALQCPMVRPSSFPLLHIKKHNNINLSFLQKKRSKMKTVCRSGSNYSLSSILSHSTGELMTLGDAVSNITESLDCYDERSSFFIFLCNFHIFINTHFLEHHLSCSKSYLLFLTKQRSDSKLYSVNSCCFYPQFSAIDTCCACVQ